MITYWKSQNGLIQTKQFEKDCWMNVINPTSSEISTLVNRFKVPDDLITDILDADERSRLEVEGKWLIFIMRIPIHNDSRSQPFTTIPMGVLLSGSFLMTICASENDLLKSISTFPKSRFFDTTKKSDFLLQLFMEGSTTYLKYLRQINTATGFIEKDLEKSTKNEELHKLLNMEKCLVYFITSLKSNELVLARLKNTKHPVIKDIDEDLISDAIIENRQAIEMSNIYSDILSGMMDAYASIISNNLNVIMKRLTSITIVLAIPTLVASIFGMNLTNNLEKSAYGFLYAVIIAVVLSGGGVILFRKLKWF